MEFVSIVKAIEIEKNLSDLEFKIIFSTLGYDIFVAYAYLDQLNDTLQSEMTVNDLTLSPDYELFTINIDSKLEEDTKNFLNSLL